MHQGATLVPLPRELGDECPVPVLFDSWLLAEEVRH